MWYDPTAGGFNPNIPDFYAHQNWIFNGDPTGWEAGKNRNGWCQFVAFADIFFDLTKQGYKDLLSSNNTDPKTWFNTYYSPKDVTKSDIFKLVSDATKTNSIQDYLDSKGHKKDDPKAPLVFNGFSVDNKGKVGNTGMSAFNFYNVKARAGDELVLKLGPGTAKAPAADAPGVWWAAADLKPETRFHMVAGAGLDLKNNTIFVADSDTNRGSALANAGWPNVAAFPGGLKSVATDPLPIPNAAKIGDPTSYNTYYAGFILKNNSDAITGDAADARYTGTTLDAILTVSAPKGKLSSATPVPAGIETSVAVTSGTATVDKVFIAPSSTVLDTTTFTSLFSFTSPGGVWKTTGESSDPFDNATLFGGVEYDLLSGTGLEPDQVATAFLGTAGDFSASGFEIFLHLSGDPLGIWDPEVIGGAPSSLDTWAFQGVEVAEPSALQLLLSGLGSLWFIAWRGTRNAARGGLGGRHLARGRLAC
jgi:hypothetical protein